ncbi:YtpI family protein [Paenibacillus thermoaerophilus]|uniref:YtpI family protein n=1 Tax=Paenibacillus thermoaerophilus TaxID=1215385 RepID=A0ABW2V255_9BACL|nr:YtpI family protein [Paenibacillus thermoaerophilus]TMV16019.1 hypothetical protein FE781_09355 [Paenibacillus thermoaerophilus]
MWIQIIMLGLLLAITCVSVYFSIRTRRLKGRKARGLSAAKTNISMGIMLIFAAVTLLFLFVDTGTRRTVATVFLIIGVFNLYAGLRSYSAYMRLPDDD